MSRKLFCLFRHEVAKVQLNPLAYFYFTVC